MWPETFGNFAPPLAKSGGWRRFAELEKPTIGGPFYEYQGRDVPPNDTRRALPTAGPSGMAEPKLERTSWQKYFATYRNWTPVFPITIYLLLWLSISRAAPKCQGLWSSE